MLNWWLFELFEEFILNSESTQCRSRELSWNVSDRNFKLAITIYLQLLRSTRVYTKATEQTNKTLREARR
jgi:hypothetical protein